MQKIYFSLFFAVFLFILDRCLKFLAIHCIDNPVKIIGSLLKFNFIPNYNIAFSLPIYGFWLNFIIILIIVILLYVCILFFRTKEYNKIICLTFIIVGSASNLIDRLQYGYVIDYFDLKYFTVFNLADVMIVVGIFCLVLLYNYLNYDFKRKTI